jgi:predicted nucleic acid-binding protein
MLQFASVFTAGFGFAELAAMTDLDESPLLDCVDEALAEELVHPLGAERYTFAHALVRQTSYEEMSSSRLELEPDQTAAISVITLGELRAGVALANDPQTRAARQARLAAVRSVFRPLPADETVAEAYGDVLATARSQKWTSKATDLLIIAIARSTGRILRTLDHAQAQLAEAVGVSARS